MILKEKKPNICHCVLKVENLRSDFHPQTPPSMWYGANSSVRTTWCQTSGGILCKTLWPTFTTTSSTPTINVSFLPAAELLTTTFNSPSDWEARKMMPSSCAFVPLCLCAFVFVQWTTAGRQCPARSVTSCLSPKTRWWGRTCTIIKPTVISGALRRSTSHPGRSEAKNETLLLAIH